MTLNAGIPSEKNPVMYRLQSYLEEHIKGFEGPCTAEKFPGGQSNPTFKLTAGGKH